MAEQLARGAAPPDGAIQAVALDWLRCSYHVLAAADTELRDRAHDVADALTCLERRRPSAGDRPDEVIKAARLMLAIAREGIKARLAALGEEV